MPGIQRESDVYSISYLSIKTGTTGTMGGKKLKKICKTKPRSKDKNRKAIILPAP
jgi:hypothetical protein